MLIRKNEKSTQFSIINQKQLKSGEREGSVQKKQGGGPEEVSVLCFEETYTPSFFLPCYPVLALPHQGVHSGH